MRENEVLAARDHRSHTAKPSTRAAVIMSPRSPTTRTIAAKRTHAPLLTIVQGPGTDANANGSDVGSVRCASSQRPVAMVQKPSPRMAI